MPKAPYTSTSLWQSQEATANQIEQMKPDAVALLGDLQYQVGRYSDFQQSYDLTYGAFKMITRPSPGNHEFYDEHGQTGVAGYGYFSYFNGFQINSSGAPITTTLADPCPSSMTGCGYPAASTTCCPTDTADGWTGRTLRADGWRWIHRSGRGHGRGRRWMVLLQSGHVAHYFAEHRVRDTAGRLLGNGLLVVERIAMAEKRSRGESFRLHRRVLAPAHVQPCQRHHPRGHYRSGLLATALSVRSRPGAERT